LLRDVVFGEFFPQQFSNSLPYNNPKTRKNMSASQILVTTGGAAVIVYLYNKYGSYDGITSKAEIKGIDIIGGGAAAMLLGYLLYGQAGGLSSDALAMALVEGGAAVAFAKLFVLATATS
jgi:hypothetical protein